MQFIHLRWSDVLCCVLNAVSQHGHTSHLSVHRALWTRLRLLIRFLTDKYMPAQIKHHIICAHAQLEKQNTPSCVIEEFIIGIKEH